VAPPLAPSVPPQAALAPPPPPPPAPRPAPAAPTPTTPDRPVAPTPPQVAALPLPPPAPPPPPRVEVTPGREPLDLTSRPPIRLGQPAAPQRGLDMRPGASLPGPGDVENLRVRGAQAGPDWRNAFRQWLDRTLRYPREAAELGEQGPVLVRITTGADGRVRRVELRQGARSIFLNHYSQAVFRGATLPAFPPGTAEEEVTIDLTINYILHRR
jgi:TonB family protein